MSTRGNICLSDAASPSLPSGLCPAHCTRDRSRARSRSYQRGAHNSRVACVSTHLESSYAPMRSLSPFFAVAFIGRAYTVRTRAYIIRSIRYLMAVSVSDVYPTLRSSPPWPGREVSSSNLRFPRARARARAMCATRARARVRAVLPFSAHRT